MVRGFSFRTSTLITISSFGRQQSICASKPHPSPFSPIIMSQPPQTRTKQTCSNSFFSTCFNRSQPALEVIDSLDYSLVDECPDDILCTETEISEYLMSLDVTKASGSDGISARMLKETAMHISPISDKNL